jgi:restriction system protein
MGQFFGHPGYGPGGGTWVPAPRAPLTAAISVVEAPPEILLNALLEFRHEVDEGRVIASVGIPWRRIVALINADPSAIYQIDGFKWEEIIAGAYEESGLFDEVILTPRSGDRGRDVIATKHGRFSVRFVDQVKAYKPGNVVTAAEVREMVGVIHMYPNVNKGLMTTTSTFAPRLLDDPGIKALVPNRLELRERPQLLEWLAELPPSKP